MTNTMQASSPTTKQTQRAWPRVLLLFLILLAFARVTWQLGGKDLWWDETLSLQRAESSLPDILLGRLVMSDGFTQVATTDQHPFLFFLLQGLLLRLAGDSEYALRFVPAMAATLLVPSVWAFARRLQRGDAFPPSSPYWAALLAAVSPFFLWYGQEARPYALWAVLAVLSAYPPARLIQEGGLSRAWIAGYIALLLMFLTSHYYAVFLLPVHALLLYLWLAERSRVKAAIIAAGLVLGGAALAAAAFWFIIVAQQGGGNFPSISLSMLGPDLLNAFSLGLSVDLADVWLLDLLFGVIAAAGAAWSLRSRRSLRNGGWLPVTLIAAPILAILVVNVFSPAYMNARHMSLLGGPFILLLGAGLGVAWRLRPWFSLLLGAALILGSGCSTFNYFTVEQYAKDDFSRLGNQLDGHIAPGDLVLIKPPFAWRAFSYYLPLATMTGMPGANQNAPTFGAPMLERDWDERFALMDELTRDKRRIWLLISGTHPYADLQGRTEGWLDDNLFKVQETTYFSHSSLKSALYLPEVPVYESLPDSLHNRVDAVLGDTIRLAGIELGAPATPDLALPVTLYWEAVTPTDRRYKYALRLTEIRDDGATETLSVSEREPYDGAIPTIYWDPGKIIVEYSELPPAPWPQPPDGADAEAFWARYRLTLQVYDAETLEPLPVTQAGAAETAEDGHTLILPCCPR